MKTPAKIPVFLEMIKFEHSVFALPFAYLGLFWAEGCWPRPALFWGVTTAMVSFRTMAMSLNRLFDRRIDGANPRTQDRALVAGRLKASFVWSAALVSLAVFEASARFLGPLCWRLSPVPVALALVYPLAKRFTWFSHFLLGIILGIAPYGAWLASRGTFSWVPGLLTLGIAAWVAGFDIIYALQDAEFDRGYGLFSVPAVFGEKFALGLTAWLHAASLAAWAWAGRIGGLGRIYAGGVVLAALFLWREHRLVRSFGTARIQEAFFMMNAVVSLTVFVAAAADVLH